jgi:GNAT superfamily N-acetyltransferase
MKTYADAEGNRGVVMELRIASEADAEKIADLLMQLGYPATEQFVGKKIPELNSHPDEKFVVAVNDGSVLGFISLHFIPQLALPGHFARISYLCVDESVRSKGVGQKLEQYAEQRARERGCDRIELHCHSRRDLAHRFYYRQGYEESPKYLMRLLR